MQKVSFFVSKAKILLIFFFLLIVQQQDNQDQAILQLTDNLELEEHMDKQELVQQEEHLELVYQVQHIKALHPHHINPPHFKDLEQDQDQEFQDLELDQPIPSKQRNEIND